MPGQALVLLRLEKDQLLAASDLTVDAALARLEQLSVHYPVDAAWRPFRAPNLAVCFSWNELAAYSDLVSCVSLAAILIGFETPSVSLALARPPLALACFAQLSSDFDLICVGLT